MGRSAREGTTRRTVAFGECHPRCVDKNHSSCSASRSSRPQPHPSMPPSNPLAENGSARCLPLALYARRLPAWRHLLHASCIRVPGCLLCMAHLPSADRPSCHLSRRRGRFRRPVDALGPTAPCQRAHGVVEASRSLALESCMRTANPNSMSSREQPPPPRGVSVGTCPVVAAMRDGTAAPAPPGTGRAGLSLALPRCNCEGHPDTPLAPYCGRNCPEDPCAPVAPDVYHAAGSRSGQEVSHA